MTLRYSPGVCTLNQTAGASTSSQLVKIYYTEKNRKIDQGVEDGCPSEESGKSMRCLCISLNSSICSFKFRLGTSLSKESGFNVIGEEPRLLIHLVMASLS